MIERQQTIQVLVGLPLLGFVAVGQRSTFENCVEGRVEASSAQKMVLVYQTSCFLKKLMFDDELWTPSEGRGTLFTRTVCWERVVGGCLVVAAFFGVESFRRITESQSHSRSCRFPKFKYQPVMSYLEVLLQPILEFLSWMLRA
jgi:hypothetical protein